MTTTITTVPESAFIETQGFVYFARMISKIKFYDAGTLREDFHDNLGIYADGWMCHFLGVNYDDLKAHVLNNPDASNDDYLNWCQENGRKLNDTDRLIWNGFASKLGWNDFISDMLNQRKVEDGLADRDDIQTMPQYFEVDEGRQK